MKSYRDANRRMLITNVSWKRRKRHFNGLLFLRNTSIYLYFALSFIWLELIFHLCFFEEMNLEFIHAMLFSVCFSAIPASICSVLPKKAGMIIAVVFSGCLFLFFVFQAVYYEMFNVFWSVSSEGVKCSFKDILKLVPAAAGARWTAILLYALPMLVLIVVGRKILSFGRLHIPHIIVAVVGAVILHVLLLFTLGLYGKDAASPYNLYNEKFVYDASAERLGLITSMRLDLKNLISNENNVRN